MLGWEGYSRGCGLPHVGQRVDREFACGRSIGKPALRRRRHVRVERNLRSTFYGLSPPDQISQHGNGGPVLLSKADADRAHPSVVIGRN